MYLGSYYSGWASLVAQWKRICLPIQEMWVRSLCGEDLLEKEMAIRSSILAWRIPWIEETDGLLPIVLQSHAQLSNYSDLAPEPHRY